MFTIPTALEITAAMDFVADLWAAFPLLTTLFALVAAIKITPYVFRKVKSLLPG